MAAGRFPNAQHFGYLSRVFFVNRLLSPIGMPLIGDGDQFAGGIAIPGRSAALEPEFHADLEF